MKHILFVEDEAALRSAVSEQLTDRGFTVEQAATGEEAVERLEQFAYDVVISDLRLPGVDGKVVIETALERYPDILPIVVTGFGTVRDAVETIRKGAWDYVSKPFQFDELLHALESGLEQRRLKSENAYLRSQVEDRYRFDGVIGRGRAMQQLFSLLETVAPTGSTILITGETGSGKEVVARAIHHNSPRRLHRFVALNCSAIPETLLEAEIFGHTRGAFTGAVGPRQGRLEQAHRGTLFLDEVGTMSAALQMKMLRVLQEREFERVGDSQTTKVDVRVIAATNSDLEKMVAAGEFREDLFYRLNVIPVQLPALRERAEDIPLLVQHFLQKFGAALGSEARGAGVAIEASQAAMRKLMAYPWPGNVRQLENAIERAVALSGGRRQIDVADLPREVQQAEEPTGAAVAVLPEEGIDLPAHVASVEKHFIDQALARTDGNKGKAATLLGLKRTTLVEKLKRM